MRLSLTLSIASSFITALISDLILKKTVFFHLSTIIFCIASSVSCSTPSAIVNVCCLQQILLNNCILFQMDWSDYISIVQSEYFVTMTFLSLISVIQWSMSGVVNKVEKLPLDDYEQLKLKSVSHILFPVCICCWLSVDLVVEGVLVIIMLLAGMLLISCSLNHLANISWWSVVQSNLSF